MRKIALLTIILILGPLLAGCAGEEEPTPTPDTTPPTISGVSASDITQTGATITWITNEPSTSQVEYGETADYGAITSLQTELVTSHSVTLSNLNPDTTYHFRVKSKDVLENEAVSADRVFATAQPIEPVVFTGTGDKTTRLFRVDSDEWQIDWSYQPANPYAVFGFLVYPEGETVVFIESVLSPTSTSDSTYLYEGNGSYYIKVTGANLNSWTIEVIPAPVNSVPSAPVTLTGSGDKTTIPFHVSENQFRVDWSYTPENEFAVFAFLVYPRGETTFFVESVMFPSGTSDTTYVYEGPGDYYIRISAANIVSWSIAIH